MKIPMLCSLLVTSMLTLKTGDRRGILTMKVSQLKTYHQHLTLTKLYVNQQDPSCIDLIFCDQPNIIVGSGVRPSLEPFYKHQIIYCNINFNMPSDLSYMRKVWHYNRANTRLIRRTISEFPWYEHLKNHNPG